MGCINCGSGFHELCEECSCCKPKPSSGTTSSVSGSPSNGGHDSDKIEEVAKVKLGKDSGGSNGPRKRTYKSPENIKDPHSTGRKRAALLYPIVKDSPCEWRGLTNCGGGKYPIVGCIEGFQQDRHHGPNKDTLHNERENVHLICKHCHNIWHSQNDPNYDPESPKHKPHEPRKAEHIELVRRYGGAYKTIPGDVVNGTGEMKAGAQEDIGP